MSRKCDPAGFLEDEPMTQESDKALEQKAERVIRELLTRLSDREWMLVKNECGTWMRQFDAPKATVLALLREVAEDAKREEAAEWEFIIGIVCTAVDRAEILRRRGGRDERLRPVHA